MLITIPIPRPLSDNKFYAGMHFRKRQEIAHEWHRTVQYAVREQFEEVPVLTDFPVRIIFTVYPPNRKMDIGNHTVKVITDGLVKIGMLPDDSLRYVQSQWIDFGGDDHLNPRIEITFQLLEAK